MALKVKKSIKQQDGTVVEVEGTEAEVEAFEKKNEKKQQSENAKKERRLLLESQKTIDKMTKKDLMELIQKMLAAAPTRDIHHWHYDNGYWWRPWWQNGIWTYQYSTNNPVYSFTTNTAYSSTAAQASDIKTCNSVADFSKTTGINQSTIATNLLASSHGAGLTTTGTISGNMLTTNAVNVGAVGYGMSSGCSSGALESSIISNTVAPLTTNFINTNFKS